VGRCGLDVCGCCEHGNEPSGFIRGGGNFLTSRMTVGLSRRTLLHGVTYLWINIRMSVFIRLRSAFIRLQTITA